METDADRLRMLRDLGAGAHIADEGGVRYSAIFENDYLLAGDVEERVPMATMRSSDVAAAGFQKDAIVEVYNPFDGSRKNYRVKHFEPDGTGMTRVILKAA